MNLVRRTLILGLVVGTSAVFAAGLSAQGDPAVGTWKLNLAKSKYNPASLAPKSQTVTIVAAGQGMKVNVQGVDSDGKPISTQYTATADGKDYPITGNADYDTASMKRIDARTTEQTRKKAGKTVSTQKRVVAADGKTMTTTVSGTNAKGQKFENTAVYDKQ